ncbi:MAG TPA: T9SS type A sorting domain-containing protein [Bacteroidota bacterium]
MRRTFLVLCIAMAMHTLSSTAQPAKFEPPAGKVYHGVGQPPMGITEYISAMGDSSFHPLVYKQYFDVPGSRPGEYNKLRTALAEQKAAGRFVELSIGFQDGTKSTDSLIAESTQYDATIDSIAVVCKEYGLRLLVRPGFEFNGSWFGYHPYLYVTAFRKVVDRFAAKGVKDSVAFQWCYYPAGPNDFDVIDAQGARWYPGDDYVDWFGLDLFNSTDFLLSLPDYAQSGQITVKGRSERFLAMARQKNKPVFLSETSAKGINTSAELQDGMNDWDNWFKPFFEYIEAHPEIKGFNYINWEWSTIQTYFDWGDARIENNSYILSQYKTELQKSKYIHLKKSTATSVERSSSTPKEFALLQNYPNPFNPTTVISYQLPVDSRVSLRVYDLLGREVATLIDGEVRAGSYTTQWDATNLQSGVYFYRLQTGQFVETRKMLLLK